MFKLQPEKWVELYREYLSSYARRRVPSNLVQDIVQDTFYAGLKSAQSFKGNAKERTWLTSILRHKIIDYYRKANSKRGGVNERILLQTDYDGIHMDEFTNINLDNNTVETDYFSKELGLIVEQGIITLTRSERYVFTLRLQGYTTTEICESLNVNENYCWSLMSKARKKMQAFIVVNWLNVA